MTKWADVCISRVRYNHDHTCIMKVEVRTDHGDTIGDPQEMSRQQVINAINTGTSVITIFMKDNKWQKGAVVEVVKVDGERFLRTDRNQRKVDNLGELPEF